MDTEKIIRNVGEMAFEHGFDNSPADLWRLYANRHWNNKQTKCSEWFATREAAFERANWIMDGRGEVISITHYSRQTRTFMQKWFCPKCDRTLEPREVAYSEICVNCGTQLD